ncbi:MAG: DeoR family transcriptional regulator [Saccharospirillaceae bacterium]|nr:DeoR family transcriptional regulator [Pseudomonadales bacterium]NRB79492.1 DeoR family transcriptional regulator [Saccharospirillaceae bacterium]
MSKRNTQQRRHQILQLVNDKQEISVDRLSQICDTSEVTIRKDLNALEKSGLLLRRFGGAIALPSELISNETKTVSIQKKQIAKKAVSLIRNHNRIVLDCGHTTLTMIEDLSSIEGLVVMTNSLLIANKINELESEPTLLMTGGTWDPHSESFQGQVAESVLQSYDFDQLFIGADGIDPARGTTTFNELMGLSRVMAQSAREVVVMVESEKIGRKIPNLELAWDQVNVLITDSKLESQIEQIIMQAGVKVLYADK